MTDTYATYDELVARLSPSYTAPSPADSAKLLNKASELINYATLGRARTAFNATTPEPDMIQALSDATCDQVEFWLEAGEEHDVLGLPKGSSLQGGRVQVQRMPGQMGQRAKRTLTEAGLMWQGGRVV